MPKRRVTMIYLFQRSVVVFPTISESDIVVAAAATCNQTHNIQTFASFTRTKI